MIIICILTLDRIFDAWTKLVLNIFNPEDGRLVRKLGRILEIFLVIFIIGFYLSLAG
jgi:hypothetical protein